jgi:hypothetical protein
VIVVLAAATLLDGSGSLLWLMTAAVLVCSPATVPTAMIVIVTCTPGVQGSECAGQRRAGLAVPLPYVDLEDPSLGVSVSRTPVAGSGPLLVTVIVWRSRCPCRATRGSTCFVTTRSDTGCVPGPAGCGATCTELAAVSFDSLGSPWLPHTLAWLTIGPLASAAMVAVTCTSACPPAGIVPSAQLPIDRARPLAGVPLAEEHARRGRVLDRHPGRLPRPAVVHHQQIGHLPSGVRTVSGEAVLVSARSGPGAGRGTILVSVMHGGSGPAPSATVWPIATETPNQ